MNILDSDIYKKILLSVNVRYEDLLCVVFFNPNLLWEKNEVQSSQDIIDSDIDKNNSEGNKESPTDENDRKEFDGETKEDSNIKFILSLVNEFVTNIDKEELQAAASVVMDDAILQNAIIAEHKALLDKGAFIPTLKLQPAEGLGGQSMMQVSAKSGQHLEDSITNEKQ